MGDFAWVHLNPTVYLNGLCGSWLGNVKNLESIYSAIPNIHSAAVNWIPRSCFLSDIFKKILGKRVFITFAISTVANRKCQMFFANVKLLNKVLGL